MKVIILKDIENVGKKFEVKEVKNGHARNFLIPQNLVIIATSKNMKWLETQRESLEKQAEEDLKKAQEMASQLDDIEVLISVKVGPEGQLFESINSTKVAEKLKEMGFVVKKFQIDLLEPIKKTGEFPVKINLDHNLEAEIKVIVLGEATSEEKE